MELINSLNDLLTSKIPNKQEEIVKLDLFVNSFKSETDYDDEIYSSIFIKLVETRLELIKEKDPEYMYFWKVFQATRLLTRNKKIQTYMYNEKHIKIYEIILDKLVKTNPSKAIDCILIELLTIIKRYLYPENTEIDQNTKEKFISLIVNSNNLLDNLITLINSNNDIILKLLKYLFKPLLNNELVINKFTNTSTIDNMIQSINRNNEEIVNIILDLNIILTENAEYRNIFIYLNGINVLIDLLQKYENKNKEILNKSLFLIQNIYKNEPNLTDSVNNNILNNLFNILLNNNDYLVSKIILNIFSAFALNDDLNVMIRTNWLEKLFKLLINLLIKKKQITDNTNNEINLIITNQMIIIRILRLIFSLEKNRKFFKELFPTNIFSLFTDIGNYKSNLSLYQNFVEILNNLPLKTINEMNKKIETLNDNEVLQTIGGYKIIEMIGKGGFGSVYKVKKNDQYFAMKAIKLEEKQMKFIRENPKDIEKAISEIKIWKQFNHPNIIKYYTSFIEKGNVYIIMELVNGISLGEYITILKERNEKINQTLMLNIICEVVSGLRYMHKIANVIYRDLNPNNIMLDNQFSVKLIDFGLTVEKNNIKNEINSIKNEKNVLSQSISPIFEGSIFYSSPEIMNNENMSTLCDIWALGCIMYEMIKLKPPFEGDNPLTIAKNICELNYQLINNSELEYKEINIIINGCLILEVDKRFNIDQVCYYLGPFLFDKMNKDKEVMEGLKVENKSLKKVIECYNRGKDEGSD